MTLAALAAASCSRCSPPADPGESVSIPRAPAPIVVDGRSDDAAWPIAWRSPALADARGRQGPHAELRLTGDDGHLYALVYVADEELRTSPREDEPRGTGDRVELSVGPLKIPLTPAGAALTNGVRAAMDVDGTVDRPGDSDEEWVTELAIPWQSLGPQARQAGVDVRIVRIDAPRGERERAMAWPRTGPAHVTLRP